MIFSNFNVSFCITVFLIFITTARNAEPWVTSLAVVIVYIFVHFIFLFYALLSCFLVVRIFWETCRLVLE